MAKSISSSRARSGAAFLIAAPIGLVGGLIGLGGAEYRLPVLVGPFGYLARRAVPLNLAISLFTVAVSLVTRSRSLSLHPLAAILPIVLAMIAGGMAAAFIGTGWFRHINNQLLERVIVLLLAAIGVGLIIEATLPDGASGLLPGGLGWQIGGGLALGGLVGLFSSLLGVAGGELIIPSLIFVFGVDVKTAGTASLAISLPTVIVGILRYARQGAYAQRSDLVETVLPMSAGSVIGAVAGGLLAGLAPTRVLKVFLGAILIGSSFIIYRRSKERT